MAVLYRTPQTGEAQAFWDMMNQLDHETDFMMYEPGERAEKAADLKPIIHLIEGASERDNFLLVGECDHRMIGYISAQRGHLNRIAHTAYIVTGIMKDYRRQGIGHEFFRQMTAWADSAGITRLELTVMCHNTAARQLYEKYGFVIEGIKKNSMIVDGEYVDEYYMAKI